jgi:hypothetical protein
MGESPGARELDYDHHMMRCKKCNGTIPSKSENHPMRKFRARMS